MEIEINSISELISHLKKEREGCDEDLWFRGQSEFSWKLSPGMHRTNSTTSESSLLSRFKQSAAMLIQNRHNEDEDKENFSWLFLMQHYGLPTRLLDWSESPLTGLYFAVNEEIKDEEDGALWMLKPTELNKIANIPTLEKNFIPSFDDEELKSYSVKALSSNPRNQLVPIATIAIRNSPRIHAQLGVFTIHHLDTKPIEEFCQKNEIIKFKIPAKSKEKLREELELLEINKFTLFPELSSIGEIIKKKFI
jgi:hypothetical protein